MPRAPRDERRTPKAKVAAYPAVPSAGRAGLILVLAAMLLPYSLKACATCFGASDEPMAKGMNMGIASLLAVVVVVLGMFASFFVFLARRSALTPMPAGEAKLHGPAETPVRLQAELQRRPHPKELERA